MIVSDPRADEFDFIKNSNDYPIKPNGTVFRKNRYFSPEGCVYDKNWFLAVPLRIKTFFIFSWGHLSEMLKIFIEIC